jgi:hypothetical protein
MQEAEERAWFFSGGWIINQWNPCKASAWLGRYLICWTWYYSGSWEEIFADYDRGYEDLLEEVLGEVFFSDLCKEIKRLNFELVS